MRTFRAGASMLITLLSMAALGAAAPSAAPAPTRVAGPGHAADSYQRVITVSTHNCSPLMQAAQNRPEKPQKRTRSLVGICYVESSNVCRVVAHTGTDHLGRLIKINNLQIPQRNAHECAHGNARTTSICFRLQRVPQLNGRSFKFLQQFFL